MKRQTLTIYKELRETFEKDEIKEIFDNMETERDFYSPCDKYRFIHQDDIDKIQQDELLSDEYVLGCFQAWFIADILDLDVEDVEKIQKAEAFEALGSMLSKHIEEVQEKYSSADGYGHHFSHYDHSEEIIGDFYMFRVN